jgi:chromosome segregation ATPase
MILCSHPNCQTTAGCVCNRLDPKAARIAELEAALSAATAERDANGREAFTQRNLAQSHEKDAAHWRVLAEKHEAAREAAEAKAARLEEALTKLLRSANALALSRVSCVPDHSDIWGDLKAARAALGGRE